MAFSLYITKLGISYRTFQNEAHEGGSPNTNYLDDFVRPWWMASISSSSLSNSFLIFVTGFKASNSINRNVKLHFKDRV